MATNDKYELNVEGAEETGELNLTDETSRSLGLDVENSTEKCVGLTMEDGTSNYLSLNLEDTISEVSVTPISTSTIDAIANGESKTGNEVATTTGLTYIFAKLKALFAPLTHTHKKADITDLTLGEADLTITQSLYSPITKKTVTKTLGTFGANATEAKTIDLPLENLVITQGGSSKSFYNPMLKTTIDIEKGIKFYICKDGEYDETTLTPTLSPINNGWVEFVYFVPLPADAKGKSDNNSYAEFVYLEATGKYESICS